MPAGRPLIRALPIVIALAVAVAAGCSLGGDAYDTEELRLLGSVRVDHATVAGGQAHIGGADAVVTFAPEFDPATDLHWPADVTSKGHSKTASDLYAKAPTAEEYEGQAPGAPGVPSQRCLLTLYVPRHLDGRLFTEEPGKLYVTCHI